MAATAAVVVGPWVKWRRMGVGEEGWKLENEFSCV